MANQTFEFTKTSHFHSYSNISIEKDVPIEDFNKCHFIEDFCFLLMLFQTSGGMPTVCHIHSHIEEVC